MDTGIFKPAPDDTEGTRDSLGIKDEEKLLLYVGRLAKEKNTRTLFRSFELLHRRHPNEFRLVVVGDGPQRNELRKLQRNSCRSSIKWIAYCECAAELASLYRAADLFVHPGVQETFGLAALESQACGTPVVGIRGSYMDSVICHNQESWAQENSPEALATAIEEVQREEIVRPGQERCPGRAESV